MRKGRFTLLNSTLTPAQATTTDLLAIAAVLDSAGFEYLLVRGNTQRPVLALDLKDRAAALTALAKAFATEPFYARTDEPAKATVLLADFLEYDAGAALRRARTLRLFRPRVEPLGGLFYGAAGAVQLEFWAFKPRVVKLPAENALTRKTTPRSDLELSLVELHGRSWRTIADMFTDHAFDVSFPIDMVFSWVDGQSAEYRQARVAEESQAIHGDGDSHESRYRQLDELKYALRSVNMFAPWIGKIFIASDSAAPEWFKEHPRIRWVRSEEHFADPSVLPTHNSMAVESQLHHIAGLSEHFLYSNDDMFFGRPLEPNVFFSPGGVSRFMLSPNRIGLGASAVGRSGFENSARVNRELLWNRFGKVATRHLEHSAAPMRRSVLSELEAEFPAEFAATAASRFRAAENISVTNSLYHYYALFTGRSVMHADQRGIYVDTTSKTGLVSLPGILKRRNADFLCLNDGSSPEVSEEVRRARVTDFLEKYFPIKAPWER